jgi:hypothetical protein
MCEMQITTETAFFLSGGGLIVRAIEDRQTWPRRLGVFTPSV